jgi:hypothetical protein
VRLLGNRPTTAREPGPLDRVDAALSMASRREFLTPDEALELLGGVQADLAEASLGGSIAGIVADAAASYSGEMMLDRRRVVDPLLDIRLAVSD